MKSYRKGILFYLLFSAVFLSCDMNFDTLEVVSCSPENNLTGISPDSYIEIKFSAGVNRTDVEDNFSLTNSEGSLDGIFEWLSSGRFRYTPSSPLSRNGRYVIELPRSIRDKDGNNMESDFISEFYVGNDFTLPVVISSTPESASGAVTGIPVDQDIIINFSKSMNRESVEREFMITPDVPGYFVWSENSHGHVNSRMTYTLTGEMEYGKFYTIKLSSSAEDSSGNSLHKDYIVNFMTGNDFTPPAVEGIYDCLIPESLWSTSAPVHNISRQVIIGLTFSKVMDRQSVEKAFSITPAVMGIFEWSSDTSLSFRPSKPLEPETKYQIYVESTAKDINLIKLSSGCSVEIITDNPDSLYVKCGTISGSNHDGDFMPLQGSWPLIIDMGSDTPVNRSYYLLINFISDETASTPALMNRYSIFDNTFIETFKGTSGGEVPDSAYIEFIEWVNSSVAKIKISGMTNKNSVPAQVPALYRIKFAGGENGIKDTRGNYMKEDVAFEFREAMQ